MLYPDGTTVNVGDFIWWNAGTRLGFVCKIIETPEDLDYWSFAFEGNPGIEIGSGHPFDPDSGFLLHRSAEFEEEGIGTLSKEETAEFERACALVKARSQVGLQNHSWDVEPQIRNAAFFAWDFTILSGEIDENRHPIALETIVILHSEVA